MHFVVKFIKAFIYMLYYNYHPWQILPGFVLFWRLLYPSIGLFHEVKTVTSSRKTTNLNFITQVLNIHDFHSIERINSWVDLIYYFQIKYGNRFQQHFPLNHVLGRVGKAVLIIYFWNGVLGKLSVNWDWK